SIRSKMPYVNEPPSRPSLYRTANSASPGASVSAEGTRMSPLAPVSVPARAGDAPKTSSAARAKISDVHCCLFTERFAMTATSLHDSLDPRHRGLRTKKGSLCPLQVRHASGVPSSRAQVRRAPAISFAWRILANRLVQASLGRHLLFEAGQPGLERLELPPQLRKVFQRLGELLSGRDHPHVLPVRPCGKAGDERAGRKVARHQPPGRHHAVVAHREVSRHSRLPGQGDPVFQPGAPRDPGHGDDEAVLAYLHVVPYLDQVVDLGAPADPGGPADAPVDGGVSPDLHVVLDHYGPDVRHFPVLAAHRDVPEPVAADDRPRVDD